MPAPSGGSVMAVHVHVHVQYQVKDSRGGWGFVGGCRRRSTCPGLLKWRTAILDLFKKQTKKTSNIQRASGSLGSSQKSLLPTVTLCWLLWRSGPGAVSWYKCFLQGKQTSRLHSDHMHHRNHRYHRNHRHYSDPSSPLKSQVP